MSVAFQLICPFLKREVHFLWKEVNLRKCPLLWQPLPALTWKGLQAVAIKFVIPVEQKSVRWESPSFKAAPIIEAGTGIFLQDFLLLFDSGVAVPESFKSLWVVIEHMGNFTVTHIPTFCCAVFS